MPNHDQIMALSGYFGSGVMMSDYGRCRNCGDSIYRTEGGWTHADDDDECFDRVYAAPELA